MRNVIMVITLFFLVAVFSVTSFAAGSVTVYAGSSSCNAGDSIHIPVSVSSNSGIMGFKLIITFPEELELIDVTANSIISEGLFNHNAGMNPGMCEVVWSNTEDVKDNGQLFTMSFKVPNDAGGEYDINIAYSNEDTFNENWDDVVLSCAPGTITVLDKNSDIVQPEQESTTRYISDYIEGENNTKGVTDTETSNTKNPDTETPNTKNPDTETPNTKKPNTERTNSITTNGITKKSGSGTASGETINNSAKTDEQIVPRADAYGFSDSESNTINESVGTANSTTVFEYPVSDNEQKHDYRWCFLLIPALGIVAVVVVVLYKKKKLFLSKPNTSDDK